MKAQNIRLLDVFVIGPLMVYAGTKQNTLPPWLNAFLVVTGAETVIYNGKNYLEIKEIEEVL